MKCFQVSGNQDILKFVRQSYNLVISNQNQQWDLLQRMANFPKNPDLIGEWIFYFIVAGEEHVYKSVTLFSLSKNSSCQYYDQYTAS